MILRKSLFLPLMAASIGGPFLFLAGENESDPQQDQQEEIVVGDLSTDSDQVANKVIYRPVDDYSQIFNFNLTPAIVESRWQEATRSAINGYQIYRSSLLVGHGPQDPVGAITYQFDDRGVLRKIEFAGLVADPSQLVNFISGRFGFARVEGASNEFRPTAFSGHTGSLVLSPSKNHKGQIKIELAIAR